MEIIFAFLIGGLFAAGIFLMLRPHLIQFLIGFLLVGNAANLLIFTVGRLGSQFPPLVVGSAQTPPEPVSNPLPQALILTAIVIGFALAAFGIVLFYRAQQEWGTLDAEEMPEAGEAAPVPSPVDPPEGEPGLEAALETPRAAERASS